LKNKKRDINKFIPIEIIFPIILLLVFTIKGFKQPFYWDTKEFLVGGSIAIFDQHSLFAYTRATDYPHTPIIPLITGTLIKLSEKLNQNPYLTIHIFSFFVSCLFLLLVYHWGFFFTNNKIGSIILCLLFATNPLFLSQSILWYFEIPGSLLKYLALLFLFKKKYKYFTITAIIAFLVRLENGPFLFLSSLIFLPLQSKQNKTKYFINYSLPIFLVSIAWILVHYLYTKWWFYSPNRYFNENPIQTLNQLKFYLLRFQDRNILSLTTIVIFLFTFKYKKLSTQQRLTNIVLLMAVIYPIIIITKLGYFLPRYTFSILPIYYLIISKNLTNLLKKHKILSLSLAVILLLFQLKNLYNSYSGNHEDSLQVIETINETQKNNQ